MTKIIKTLFSIFNIFFKFHKLISFFILKFYFIFTNPNKEIKNLIKILLNIKFNKILKLINDYNILKYFLKLIRFIIYINALFGVSIFYNLFNYDSNIQNSINSLLIYLYLKYQNILIIIRDFIDSFIYNSNHIDDVTNNKSIQIDKTINETNNNLDDFISENYKLNNNDFDNNATSLDNKDKDYFSFIKSPYFYVPVIIIIVGLTYYNYDIIKDFINSAYCNSGNANAGDDNASDNSKINLEYDNNELNNYFKDVKDASTQTNVQEALTKDVSTQTSYPFKARFNFSKINRKYDNVHIEKEIQTEAITNTDNATNNTSYDAASSTTVDNSNSFLYNMILKYGSGLTTLSFNDSKTNSSADSTQSSNKVEDILDDYWD